MRWARSFGRVTHSGGKRATAALAGATVVAMTLLLPGGARADKPRKPTPVNAATTYPLHETHAAEHVTIAVQPGDTNDTNPDTRLDYLHHGYLPLRVIVTNDGDQPVELYQARMLFVAADNSVTNAATEDDLQRRMFVTKQVEPTKIPIVPITIHHEQVDSKIVKDMDDFGFPATTVAPHSTASGWLFYNVRDLDEPVLDGAVLEIRKVRFAEAPGKPVKTLDTFLISLKASDGKPAGEKKELDKPSNDSVLKGSSPLDPAPPINSPKSPSATNRTPAPTAPCDDPPCTDTTIPR